MLRTLLRRPGPGLLLQRRRCSAAPGGGGGGGGEAGSERVRVEQLGGGVRKVVLSRGAKLNVMDGAFFAQLRAAFEEASADEGCRAVVLAAEGRHFTAGLDLKAAAAMFFDDQSAMQKARVAGAAALGFDPNGAVCEKGMPAMRQQKLHKLIREWQAAITSLEACRVPVVAAVHGKCIGGGLDLVTAADFRVASRCAVFCAKEVEVGIVADLGTLQRLPGIVGQGVAREMALTACDVAAERALAVGLVNSVHDSPAEAEAAAVAAAQRIASMSPLAVQGTKEVMNAATEPAVSEGLRRVALHNSAFLKSNDLLQAVVGFVKKTAPAFTDYVLPKKP